MLWLRWLEPDLGKLVWARASGTGWKPICWQFGISRATAHRRWRTQRHRVAAERAAGADEAGAAVRGGGGARHMMTVPWARDGGFEHVAAVPNGRATWSYRSGASQPASL